MRDKKRIEEGKRKKTEELGKDLSKDVKPQEERKKSYPIETNKSLEIKVWDEPLFSDINKDEIKSEIGDIIPKKAPKLKKNMKEDILKGVIYSEILSKPKSLSNRKSM